MTVALVAGLILAAAAIATAGIRVAHRDKILPGTTMLGVQLGGLTGAAATDKLTTAHAGAPSVTFTGGPRPFAASAAQAGYRLDVAASVARARRAGRDGPLWGAWSTLSGLFSARELDPVTHVDAARVTRLVSQIARDIGRAPADARIRAPARPRAVLESQGDAGWRPRRATIAVHPSAPGRRLRRTAAAAAITVALRGGRRTVALEITRIPARLTTGAARKVTSLLGTFTTRYPCCEPRVTNIRLIADAVDRTIVLPGERFSLNQATGKRTPADGYVPAPFIADGKIVPSIGGGVSQFSTTLYNAAYFAGLRIDTHRPHSFYIARYPPGREATLNYGDIDLAWTNDTSSPVLIRTATDATSVVVSLYGVDHGRRVRSQAGERSPPGSVAFAVTVTRVVRYRDGRTVRQPFTTRYDPPPPPE